MMELSQHPKNRYELERKCYLLAEALNSQKLRFSPNVIRTIYSIKNVRFLLNRRIDLLTIDESMRAIFVALEGLTSHMENKDGFV